MIVSTEHKYVFIQFPQTASTAIGEELVRHYDGEEILRKHSNYHHFQEWAGERAGDYFVFSSIRNPLEKQISLYYKFATNHKGFFTDPSTWKQNGGWISRREQRRFRFIRDKNASFQDFFRRFFLLPYVDWSVLAHKRMDFIIRYESLQRDFETVLDQLGLDLVRELPAANPTAKERKPLSEYYPATMSRRSCWVMVPMLDYWGYSVPSDWDCSEVSIALSKALFRAIAIVKGVYYNHFW